MLNLDRHKRLRLVDVNLNRLHYVDWGLMVLGVAGFEGDITVLMVEVEPEPLGGLEMVDAHVVLGDPSGVRASGTAEVVEGVVVDVVLRALVVEVHFLFAVELALPGVLLAGADDVFPHLDQFELGALKAGDGYVDLNACVYHVVIGLLVLACPRPVGVISAYTNEKIELGLLKSILTCALHHGDGDVGVGEHVDVLNELTTS